MRSTGVQLFIYLMRDHVDVHDKGYVGYRVLRFVFLGSAMKRRVEHNKRGLRKANLKILAPEVRIYISIIFHEKVLRREPVSQVCVLFKA